MLTTITRRKLEDIIIRIGEGNDVSLTERIELQKYSERIPFIAGKLNQAISKRELLNEDGLI